MEGLGWGQQACGQARADWGLDRGEWQRAGCIRGAGEVKGGEIEPPQR
jgi:hypothetical protein